MSMPLPILIAGPTAVGKTEIALLVAEQLGGEIISVDSMQVYRGMDIGTAKPSAEERRRVPHHLLDVADLTETFDAARFAKLARAAIGDIQSRKRVPILCGGTGLYFKAVTEGVGESPAAEPALRRELESAHLTELLAELKRRDPKMYGQIDRNNPRRVIRAIEVIRLTGRPFSEQRVPWNAAAPSAASAHVLARSMPDLRARIDRRVDEMFRRGLVEETRALLERGLAGNRTAIQALGYRQVVEHLEGERALAETIELVKVRTRQYAKRQLTWFRRHLRAEPVHLEPETDPSEVARQIVGGYGFR
jgi:tRNA dimethylallyltransferase